MYSILGGAIGVESMVETVKLNMKSRSWQRLVTGV